MSSDEAARAAALERVGWNVFRLDEAEVPLDVVTDVGPRSFHPEVQRAEAEAIDATLPDPDLAARAAAIVGEARFVFCQKGRAAERALCTALLPGDGTVLTTGLFRTTERAVRLAGARLELSPRRDDDAGRSNVDLTWLGARLGRGDVVAVYLEAANNGLGGWPLDVDNVEAAAALCRRAGVPLLLDGARLLANAIALGAPVLAAVRRMAEAADALTVSCAKEYFVPAGGFVAVRDAALARRIEGACHEDGTLLELRTARRALARGLELVAGSQEALVRRRERLARLSRALRDEGVEVIEPIGAHAVYAVLGADFGDGAHREAALLALLYRLTGVRAAITVDGPLGPRVMRLAVPPLRFRDEQLDYVAWAIGELRRRAGEAPRLVEADEPGAYRPA